MTSYVTLLQTWMSVEPTMVAVSTCAPTHQGRSSADVTVVSPWRATYWTVLVSTEAGDHFSDDVCFVVAIM